MSKYKTYHVTIEAITDIICSPRGSNQKINGLDFKISNNEIKWEGIDKKRKIHNRIEEEPTIIYPAYFNSNEYYIPGSTIKGNLLKQVYSKDKRIPAQILVSDFVIQNSEKIKISPVYKLVNLFRDSNFIYYIENSNLYFSKEIKIINPQKIKVETNDKFYNIAKITENETITFKLTNNKEETIQTTDQKIKEIKKIKFFKNIVFEIFSKGSIFKGKIRVKADKESLENFQKDVINKLKFSKNDFTYGLSEFEQNRIEKFQSGEEILKNQKYNDNINQDNEVMICLGGYRGQKNAFNNDQKYKSGIFSNSEEDLNTFGIIKLTLEEAKE